MGGRRGAGCQSDDKRVHRGRQVWLTRTVKRQLKKYRRNGDSLTQHEGPRDDLYDAKSLRVANQALFAQVGGTRRAREIETVTLRSHTHLSCPPQWLRGIQRHRYGICYTRLAVCSVSTEESVSQHWCRATLLLPRYESERSSTRRNSVAAPAAVNRMPCQLVLSDLSGTPLGRETWHPKHHELFIIIRSILHWNTVNSWIWGFWVVPRVKLLPCRPGWLGQQHDISHIFL